MKLKSGTLLQGGKYRIERVLGQGGFGITYLAVQEMLDRKVCIKEFFYKEYCERNEETSHVTLGTQSTRELVERFLNKFLKEARTISKLEHPNIIRIFDIFTENNTAYYVMEYVEGESLAEKVKREGALPVSEAVSYIYQVASALDFVHRQSINHLDVKPANIMVRKVDNRAILIDFGLSKQYDNQGGQTSTTPVGISHGYAPMEQYNAGGVSVFTPQTDIYSLGATLYKLVTGITPPQASDVLNDGLPELPAHLLGSVKNVIIQSMQVRKKDRPADIRSFISLLSDYNANDNKEPEKGRHHTINNDPIDEETKVISSAPAEENIKEKEQKKSYKKQEKIAFIEANGFSMWRDRNWFVNLALLFCAFMSGGLMMVFMNVMLWWAYIESIVLATICFILLETFIRILGNKKGWKFLLVAIVITIIIIDTKYSGNLEELCVWLCAYLGAWLCLWGIMQIKKDGVSAWKLLGVGSKNAGFAVWKERDMVLNVALLVIAFIVLFTIIYYVICENISENYRERADVASCITCLYGLYLLFRNNKYSVIVISSAVLFAFGNGNIEVTLSLMIMEFVTIVLLFIRKNGRSALSLMKWTY